MAQDVIKRIRKLRNKLHKSIQKNGLNSEETRKISDEIDILIDKYYKSIKQIEYPSDSDMLKYYEYSYNELKSITKQFKKFPIVQEWDKYAQESNCLSHMSLEYVSKLKWNYLRVKVLRELNMKM